MLTQLQLVGTVLPCLNRHSFIGRLSPAGAGMRSCASAGRGGENWARRNSTYFDTCRHADQQAA
eukprot:6366843-Amphidinium_carterae.2